MRSLRLPLLAALASLAACSDSPTWNQDDPAGRIKFQVTSLVRSGTFVAAGVQPSSIQPGDQYASAMTDGTAVLVGSYAERQGGAERAFVTVPSRRTGSYTFTERCTDATRCAGIEFTTWIWTANLEMEPVTCYVTSGGVRVTRTGERRIAGTFFGNGDCYSDAYTGSMLIEISHGSFDTPITGAR